MHSRDVSNRLSDDVIILGEWMCDDLSILSVVMLVQTSQHHSLGNHDRVYTQTQ